MQDNLVSFKCPSCDTSLLYDAAIGKFRCPACGNRYDLSVIHNAAASDEPSFDWGDHIASFVKEDLTGSVTYSCKYCGADIVTDAITSATHCPYCDNEIIINQNLEGALRPNYIIPFKIVKKDLADMWKDLVKKKKLLPKKLVTDVVIDKAIGLYVPFWLYDCTADGKVTFETTTTRSWYSFNYRYTETKYYYVTVDGEVGFKKIPVDASIKMDDNTMDLLEPYDYSQLEEFAPGYLSGFLADRYDDDPEACTPRAGVKVSEGVNKAFSNCVTGYSSVRKVSDDLILKDTEAKYALLPVYVMKAKYGGNTYTYTINGQTGKIVGEFPKSKFRWLKNFAISAGIIAAVLMIIMFLLR
ncbi:MAG: hypothetical protein K6G89_07360 [Clostridia bacterium]|nr:hypothetical protein [Clostridia bacterium]